MSAYVSTTGAQSFNVGGVQRDDFRAIPYRDKSGELRICVINHHQFSGTKIFWCFDTTTVNFCPGFPTPLPKGDIYGKTSGSGNFDYDYYIDPLGKLYYAVTASDNEFGLGCFNLDANRDAVFTSLVLHL